METDMFWKFLEDTPGQSLARREWRNELKNWDKFEHLPKYLKLSPGYAEALDCETPDCLGDCARQIVMHSKENIVAICPENDARPYSVPFEDILFYTFDHTRFYERLCLLFDLKYRESKLADCPDTWRIGDYIPTAGMVFPAYVSFSYNEHSLLETVKLLCLLHETPFIIINPTRRRLSPQIEQLLLKCKALFLSLEEELFFNQEGEINAHRQSEDIFAPLLQTLPEPYKNEPVFFPTPSGAKWEDLNIFFLDNHTVRVQVGDIRRDFDYAEMGMSKKNLKEPCKSWLFLLALADGDGIFINDNDSPRMAKACTNRKYELVNALRQFFRIEKGNPLDLDSDNITYRCRFLLRKNF